MIKSMLEPLDTFDINTMSQGIIKYAHFPVFLLNFHLLFFSGSIPVSMKWLSHVLYGISLFLSLIHPIEFSLQIDFFSWTLM